MRFILSLVRMLFAWTGWALFLVLFSVIAWFIPWVFAFHLGFLIYFPYEPDGVGRFTRVTGPLASGNSWVSSADLPRSCKAALVASEDTKFFIHNGVDLESIEKSMEYNRRLEESKNKRKKKQPKRGGSTITQQLVKNAFLSRDRTYLRKVREIVGAVVADMTMSKDSQLTWYFNLVEFGPRVYGIEEAALRYFNKHAKSLNPAECVALVAILPSPKKWNRSLEKKSLSGFFMGRYHTVVARMDQMDIASAREISFARSHSPIQRAVWTPTEAEKRIVIPEALEPEEVEDAEEGDVEEDVVEALGAEAVTDGESVPTISTDETPVTEIAP